jgi:hypothetical protein
MRLSKSDLRENLHHFRPSEGLGSKDDVWMVLLNATDQPFPKGDWLGVWVVAAKNLDYVLNPKEHNATQFLDQRMLIRGIEVKDKYPDIASADSRQNGLSRRAAVETTRDAFEPMGDWVNIG